MKILKEDMKVVKENSDIIIEHIDNKEKTLNDLIKILKFRF